MSEENLIKTGYPHIDRPWMKWYDKERLQRMPPKMNIQQYIRNENVGREQLTARTYYGKKTTYGEMFQKQDEASRVFSELGVKKQDRIMYLVPNIPESGDLWLGAAQIGAISDFVDPRPDSMDLKANSKKVLELIKGEKAKYLVAIDQAYLGILKPIENEIKDLGIEKIITLSANDSMDLSGKINYLLDVINYNAIRNEKLKGTTVKKLKWYQALKTKIQSLKKMDELYKKAVKTSPLEILSYSELVKECKSSFRSVYEENLVQYIGHTSGTSGSKPKPIPVTNEEAISAVEQIRSGELSLPPRTKVLHVLPFFAPFGAYNNFLSDCSTGCNHIEVPEFEISEFAYLIKKYRPNAILGTPAWLSKLPDCKYLKGIDLSCVEKIGYGGDSMDPEDEERLNTWLRVRGSKAVIEKGHGMSEYCGVGAYAQKDYNKLGSIGIPMPDTIYTIVDPENEDDLVPLKFKDDEERLKGELVVSSDAVTSGKLDGKIIVPHYTMDNLDCIRTRDLVEMDRDGIFYHVDRKDRAFTRFDGYKVIPAKVEDAIVKNEKVKYAKVVPYFSEGHNGNMPICHLVLHENITSKDDKEKIVQEIVNKQIIGNPEMSSRQIPTKFKFREELPLSKNSKVDFVELTNEALTGEEINVDIHETNLAVEGITVY